MYSELHDLSTLLVLLNMDATLFSSAVKVDFLIIYYSKIPFSHLQVLRSGTEAVLIQLFNIGLSLLFRGLNVLHFTFKLEFGAHLFLTFLSIAHWLNVRNRRARAMWSASPDPITGRQNEQAPSPIYSCTKREVIYGARERSQAIEEFNA